LSVLVRGLYVVVVARALGPQAYGEFNYGLAWYLVFIALTYLGLDTYLARRIGSDRSQASDALYQTLVIRVVLAVVAAIASWSCAWLVQGDLAPRKLIGILSIGLLGRALWLWAVSAFTAFERSHYALALDAIFRPLEVGAALAVLAYRRDLHLLAMVHAALWCLQGVVSVDTVRRRLAPLSGHVTVRGSLSLLATTFPAGVYTIVASIFMQAPIVMIKLTERVQVDLGQFALAYQSCVYLLVIPYVVSSAMLPVAARAVVRGDGKDTALVGLLVRVTCVFGVAAVVLSGPLLPPLVEALFGARYQPAGALLQLAVWLVIPFSVVTFLLQLFFARGAYAPAGWHGAAGVLAMCLMFPPAVAQMAGAGALLSVGAGLSVWYLFLVAVAPRFVPGYDRSGSLRAFGCACAAAVAFGLMGSEGALTQATATLAILMVACIASGALRRSDLGLLASLLSRR
jgi:O-antigen/teichoic acid export membrane protein